MQREKITLGRRINEVKVYKEKKANARKRYPLRLQIIKRQIQERNTKKKKNIQKINT